MWRDMGEQVNASVNFPQKSEGYSCIYFYEGSSSHEQQLQLQLHGRDDWIHALCVWTEREREREKG